jgi:hypothetical protein
MQRILRRLGALPQLVFTTVLAERPGIAMPETPAAVLICGSACRHLRKSLRYRRFVYGLVGGRPRGMSRPSTSWR